jgi:hypothetical protein
VQALAPALFAIIEHGSAGSASKTAQGSLVGKLVSVKPGMDGAARLRFSLAVIKPPTSSSISSGVILNTASVLITVAKSIVDEKM